MKESLLFILHLFLLFLLQLFNKLITMFKFHVIHCDL